LDIHAKAFAAALGAVCAGEQNYFWQMHDALFGMQDLNTEALNTMAKKIGLNVENFKNCLSSPGSRDVVQMDLFEARRLGINSTPTFLVNGKLLRGAASLESFKSTINQELKGRTRSTQDSRSSSPENK
jgi:protein-disulfide isomerase